MKVGDKVNYVPDMCHALTSWPMPWAVGRKDRKGKVEELTGPELERAIVDLKRKKTTLDKEGLVLLRPTTTWPAVITAINGSEVSIDVDQPFTPTTLHVTVKVDDTGVCPHTCFPCEKEVAPKLVELKKEKEPVEKAPAEPKK